MRKVQTVQENQSHDAMSAARAGVVEWLFECGGLVRRDVLPDDIRRLVGAVSSLPDFIRDKNDYAGDVKVKRRGLSVEDHATLEKFLDVIVRLPANERRAVFGKACGYSFRKIAKSYHNGISHHIVRRRYYAGITTLLIYFQKK